MKEKAIVILTPGFPKDMEDQTCLPQLQVIVKSVKRQFDPGHVIIISFQYPYKSFTYVWNGCEVINLGGRNKNHIYRVLLWIKALNQLLRLEKKYDLVSTLSFWFDECALVGTLFKKIRNIKHYSWVLGQDAKAGNRYLKWIKPDPSTIIALSDFIAGELERNYRLKIKNIIPPGIETGMFNDMGERNIDIMGAGSLIPIKQYDKFISIVKYLKQEIPGIKTVICGKGTERERLEELVKQENLEENILLPGELSHSQVIQLMTRSKVFLHTSAYEGFGAVMSEALFAGAHVFSFCRPMKKDYDQWHIAGSVETMQKDILLFLQQKEINFRQVLVSSADETATKLLEVLSN